MCRISTGLPVVSLTILLLIGGVASERSTAQTPQAGAVTALTGARVIDGTGRPPLNQATVLMSNGRIVAVGAASAVAVPAGATRIDMTGKTIMPGIVNAHGHVQKGFNNSVPIPIREDLIRRLRMYAAYGVTTVVNLGANPDDELEGIKQRDEQGAIALDRARIYTSGASVRRMKTPEDARKDVDRVADLKVDVVKFHFDDPPNAMSAETWGAIVEQAHKRGLRVAPHIFYLRDAKAAVEKGVDALAHSVRDLDVDQALIAEMKRRNVGYIPTLTREVSVFVYETTPAFFTDPFFLRGISLYRDHVNVVSAPAYQEKLRNDPAAQAIKKALVQANRNLKILSDAGVPIGFGTDGGVPNNATFGRWEGSIFAIVPTVFAAQGPSPGTVYQRLDAVDPVIRRAARDELAARAKAELPQIERILLSDRSSVRLRVGVLSAINVTKTIDGDALSDEAYLAIVRAASDPDPSLADEAYRFFARFSVAGSVELPADLGGSRSRSESITVLSNPIGQFFF